MLNQGLQRYLSPTQRKLLGRARVGLAGAGGLGSNAAMLLARCGVAHFVAVDGDVVEPSNLNRQHYFPRHVGMHKVAALADMLVELNPAVQVARHTLWLDANNIPELLLQADIWIEALDEAQMKRTFVECALAAGLFVASASGIAGYGGPPLQKRRLGDRLVLVGDFATDIADHPPLAPRVMQAAAMQADAVLEHILGPCDDLPSD